MGLREQLQHNQAAFAVLAVGVIACSVYFVARDRQPGSGSGHAYFFDLGTGMLFAADSAAQPPIDAASGPGKGVAAVVYGCGDCRKDNLKIAYLTTLTPEARHAADKLNQPLSPGATPDTAAQFTVDQGTMVAEPTTGGAEPKWYPAMSPAGVAIKSRTMNLCGGKPPSGSCFPG